MIIKLINVRLAFPALFEAKSVGDSGEPRFSAAFPVEPGSENHKLLQGAIEKGAAEKWGAKAAGILEELKGKGRLAYKHAALSKDGSVYDGFADMYTLNASSKVRPGAYAKNASPVTEQDGVIYAGCYVDAEVDVWFQDNSWGKRVNATLRYVQFRNHGDAFGGGAPVDPSSIQAIEDGATAEDLI